MGRRRGACLVSFLCLAACEQQPAETPSIHVPDALKPPRSGSPGPRLDSLEERYSDGVPERRLPPPGQPIVPPSDWGGCLRSRMCQLEGMCTPGGEGLCIAADNDDCKPSDACLGGRCSAREGRCVAATDEDCRGSWACRGWGRCSHDGSEACMATSAADCLASTRCKREGECRLLAGACAASVATPSP